MASVGLLNAECATKSSTFNYRLKGLGVTQMCVGKRMILTDLS